MYGVSSEKRQSKRYINVTYTSMLQLEAFEKNKTTDGLQRIRTFSVFFLISKLFYFLFE